MANFTLPIGTSDPLTVCDGLPLFPNGAARAGIYGSFRSFQLLDVSGTIFVARLKVSAYARYAFGVCGPAVAFLFKNVQAETGNQNDEGKLTLSFQDGQQLEAGGFIGASVGAGINLAFQIYRPTSWYKPWQFSWQNAFAISLDVSIDFLGLFVALIKYLLSRNSRNTFKEADESVLPGIQSYAFLDFIANSGVQRELSAAPELIFPINIANLVPGLKALNASFSKIGGEISVGPSLHIGLPVTLALDSFIVQGGLQGENSATYGKLVYQDNDKVVATGNVLFDESVTPTKMTTAVHYETGFALGLSFHFRVTVAKMFNFEVNGPTLNFTQLLYGSSNDEPTIAQDRSVSTGIQNGCLLLPNLTLHVKGVNSPNISTGDQVVGGLNLSMPYPGPTAENNVSLKIEPDVPGFPKFLTIANGATSSNNFYYAFPNQSLLTGNLYDPSETTPPGPEYTVQTYTVTARIPYLSGQPCSEFEVVLPLNVNTRYIRCQRTFGVAGSAPPWDESANALASATVNATTFSAFVGMSCWFPYPPDQAPAAITITFTLLDESRLPHSGSNVEVASGGATAKLSPSATLNVTPASAFAGSSGSNLSISWLSKATPPYNNYSNRFFLVIDAGPAYGQTEFWLDVWNWS